MLMFSLPPENWWRLIAWMVLGLIIYFSYGYSHSELRMRTEAAAAAGGARRR
jgi:APA family basic amino acid/polyamine antiporter